MGYVWMDGCGWYCRIAHGAWDAGTVAWVSLWTWVFGITQMRGIGIGIGIGEQEEVMSSLAG